MLAVDDEQFAVVALVPLPTLARRQRIDGVELQHLHAGRAEALEEGIRCAEGAGAVAQTG